MLEMVPVSIGGGLSVLAPPDMASRILDHTYTVKDIPKVVLRMGEGKASIVKHLPVIRNSDPTSFLGAFSGPLAPLVGLQAATLGVSLVNLGLTAGLFLYVHYKFKQLDRRLDLIEANLDDIKRILVDSKKYQEIMVELQMQEWHSKLNAMVELANEVAYKIVQGSVATERLETLSDEARHVHNIFRGLSDALLDQYPYLDERFAENFYNFLLLRLFTGFIKVRTKIDLNEPVLAEACIRDNMREIEELIHRIKMRNLKELHLVTPGEKKLLEIMRGCLVKYAFIKKEMDVAYSVFKSFREWEDSIEEAKQKIENLGEVLCIIPPEKFNDRPYEDTLFELPSLMSR